MNPLNDKRKFGQSHSSASDVINEVNNLDTARMKFPTSTVFNTVRPYCSSFLSTFKNNRNCSITQKLCRRFICVCFYSLKYMYSTHTVLCLYYRGWVHDIVKGFINNKSIRYWFWSVFSNVIKIYNLHSTSVSRNVREIGMSVLEEIWNSGQCFIDERKIFV